MENNTVTINTDASFCPHTKAAGYAFWISSSSGRVVKSGPLKEARNPDESEMQAIANALHALLTHPFYKGKKFDKLWINSDSTNCLRKINKKVQDTEPSKYVKDTLAKLLDEHGQVICKHVKAHKFTGTSRSYVNHWCDREAKKHMRALRNKLNRVKEQTNGN